MHNEEEPNEAAEQIAEKEEPKKPETKGRNELEEQGIPRSMQDAVKALNTIEDGETESKPQDVPGKHYQQQNNQPQGYQPQNEYEAQIMTEHSQLANDYNQFVQMYGNVDWEGLKTQLDPETWKSEFKKYVDLKNSYNERANNLNNALTRYQETRQEDAIKEYNAKLTSEKEKLLDLIPEWRDKKVFDQEKEELKSYLMGAGYKLEEIRQLTDHRHVKSLYDAWQYEKSKTEKAKPKKVNTKRAADNRVERALRKSNTHNNRHSIEAAAIEIRERGIV